MMPFPCWFCIKHFPTPDARADHVIREHQSEAVRAVSDRAEADASAVLPHTASALMDVILPALTAALVLPEWAGHEILALTVDVERKYRFTQVGAQELDVDLPKLLRELADRIEAGEVVGGDLIVQQTLP